VCGILSLASDEEVLPLARRVAINIERSNTSASDLFDSVYSAKIKAQSSGSVSHVRCRSPTHRVRCAGAPPKNDGWCCTINDCQILKS
jgi:hypothetical protein